MSEKLDNHAFSPGNTDYIDGNWTKLRNTVMAEAKATFGVMKKVHQDWFDDNGLEIKKLLAEKYATHKSWLAGERVLFVYSFLVIKFVIITVISNKTVFVRTETRA